jgi:hypothetical protein
MQQTILSTCGDGYWSDVAKPVLVTDLRLGYVNEDKDFGELRVYFDTAYWNVNEDGLIYTDSLFYAELQEYIKAQGLVVDLCYSEQGMQGDDYVSLDVGKEFLDSWAQKFGQEEVDRLAV